MESERFDAFEDGDDWAKWVKSHDIEDYDWVDVADHFRGPEAVFHRLRARLIRRIVSNHQDATFLDAGCGTGLNLRNLSSESIGLDINPRNITLVKERLPHHGAVIGDIEYMPFLDESVEGVLCTEVLEHIPSPSRALHEIRRVLKPSGALIGTVPTRSPIWMLRFLSSTCPADEPFHNQYSRARVLRMLEKFEILQVRYVLFGSNVLFIARKPS